jgi:Cu/Ag efflux pump CusA
VGGVLAALAGGGIISLGSLVGFITVLGIAARNGIMMINHFQHLERYEDETFGPEMILRGARERLAPILMTATTMGLGERSPQGAEEPVFLLLPYITIRRSAAKEMR